jgi:CO/xanthine dehydrogenase FAD-binding subunit
MDQNTIQEYIEPAAGGDPPPWQPGDAWLGGGTHLFATPMPHLRRVIDLTTLAWPSLSISDEGLEIAATCTVHELFEFVLPSEWKAGPLLRKCVEAFLGSFKIWHTQTVGGNICTSLPAGPMITMSCALDATYELWGANGSRSSRSGRSTVSAISFVTGDGTNILEPGQILRSILIPRAALARKFALRRFTLTQMGRSSVFLVGTLDSQSGEFLLTVSAATIHPVQLRFPCLPQKDALQSALHQEITEDLYFFDPNGRPDHRQHLTHIFAEEIRQELSA